MKRFITRFLLPVAVVGAAAAGAMLMIETAESAEREAPVVTPPLVEFVVIQAIEQPITVLGNGVVEPARQVELSAEVAGKLIVVSDDLVVGGRVAKGDLMARVNGKRYKLTVRERRTRVEQAKLELRLEGSRGAVAKREWGLLGRDSVNNELALRKPQYAAAQVAVESARAALDNARYDTQHTALRAPFNATVLTERAELGQYVTPGASIATLVGTDEFLVRVSVPVEKLAHLDIPGLQSTAGSTATVVQDLGGSEIVREGKVVRLVGELDSVSRTAQVLVEVQSPLDPPQGELPLLPGAFVTVRFAGKTLGSMPQVPRAALVDGRYVWSIEPDNTLAKHELTIAWQDNEHVYVRSGIEPGIRLLLTDLPALTQGMVVRTEDSDNE